MNDAECADWCIRALRRMGKRLSGENAARLVFTVGRDAALLRQEMDKLCAYLGERGEIAAEDIDQICTRSTECTVFQMVDAQVAGNNDTGPCPAWRHAPLRRGPGGHSGHAAEAVPHPVPHALPDG